MDRKFNFPLHTELPQSEFPAGMQQRPDFYVNQIETCINDIARNSNDKEVLRRYALHLIKSKPFKALMMGAIIINFILMVLPLVAGPRSDAYAGEKTEYILSIVENIIVGIFLVEIMLKLFALGKGFH